MYTRPPPPHKGHEPPTGAASPLDPAGSRQNLARETTPQQDGVLSVVTGTTWPAAQVADGVRALTRDQARPSVCKGSPIGASWLRHGAVVLVPPGQQGDSSPAQQGSGQHPRPRSRVEATASEPQSRSRAASPRPPLPCAAPEPAAERRRQEARPAQGELRKEKARKCWRNRDRLTLTGVGRMGAGGQRGEAGPAQPHPEV